MREKGLRKKILLSMVLLLLTLGIATILINQIILNNIFKEGYRQLGLAYARGIASRSLVDVLTMNGAKLNKILINEKSLDDNIAYIFITDSSNSVLAHTFQGGFPRDLTGANTLPPDRDFNIQLFDTQMGFIYDIAVPVVSKESTIGEVRLGILKKGIHDDIAFINFIILSTTVVIVVVGILLACKISALITKPITKLVDAARSIQNGNFSVRIDAGTQDEIGLLAAAFNEMASRIHQMVAQIEQFAKVEERNKIAFDLHDGCAQHSANIIKRIELCEKLFKVDPLKACKELEDLKESTRDTLNWTRQMVFDLKAPDDTVFHLQNRLNNYIRAYRERNNINVKLDVTGSLNSIHADRAKSIFYIIAEALANVRKHSRAKNAELFLDASKDNSLLISIKDDGMGFNVRRTKLSASSQGKWGLITMRERTESLGGAFNIKSISGQGTMVSIAIPLAGTAA